MSIIRRMAAERVLIADDHPLYRDALRAIVPQACAEAELVEAANQSDVLGLVTSDAAFDLIVLDLNLPGVVGLSLLHTVRERAPLTPVLIVSAVDDPGVMRDVIRAGATGYVPKSAQRQMLVTAIQVVLGGDTYVPIEGLMALHEAQSRPAVPVEPSKCDRLTSRQQRVLSLLADGKSNKQIAGELDISEITVKAHVSSILKKLGVNNRVQAALEARKTLSD